MTTRRRSEKLRGCFRSAPGREPVDVGNLNRANGDWARVRPRNVSKIAELPARNLKEDQRGNQNIRLSMQVSRFLPDPPSLEDVVEQLQYWRAEPGSVNAKYYAYVVKSLMAMGSPLLAHQRHERNLEGCRELTRFWRKRNLSYEPYRSSRQAAKTRLSRRFKRVLSPDLVGISRPSKE